VGLLYSAFTVGLSLSFRVLNFPDLGVEGSAILGASLCAAVLTYAHRPWLALLVGTIGGACAGLFTACQHLYLGVSKLLAGIITAAVLYSLNVRILGGRPNVRLSDVDTVFDLLNRSQSRWAEIAITGSLLLAVVVLCSVLFTTKGGYLLRTLGSNERFVVALGHNPRTVTMWGLMLSNAVIGFGGALLVQYKHACDVNMSIGLLVSALAALVIGEALYAARTMMRHFATAIAGTVIYNAAIALVLFSWSQRWDKLVLASDVRMFSGLLLLIPIVAARRRRDGFRLFRSDW